MRLIDADKIIEKCIYYFKIGKRLEWMQDVVDLINEQPTVDRWIPCSERLPDESGYYYITVYRKVDNTRFARRANYDSGIWYYEDGDVIYGRIFAWQPLPPKI